MIKPVREGGVTGNEIGNNGMARNEGEGVKEDLGVSR